MRKVKITISGGTAEEQAARLRELAFTVEHHEEYESERDLTSVSPAGKPKHRMVIVEMADYDRKVLANAWLHAPAGRSVNKLARATQIECMRLYGILLGEKRATVKELDAICEELNISVESVRAENAES